MTVEGELDDISGAGQTHAGLGLCSGVPTDRKLHFEAAGAGHYGIFSGKRWRENIYPEVRAFILSHHKTNPVSSDKSDVEAEKPTQSHSATSATSATSTVSATAPFVYKTPTSFVSTASEFQGNHTAVAEASAAAINSAFGSSDSPSKK